MIRAADDALQTQTHAWQFSIRYAQLFKLCVCVCGGGGGGGGDWGLRVQINTESYQ